MALITKIPGITFTDTTLPKLYRDGWIDANTLFLFDLGNSYCTGGKTTLANNDTLLNLVDGAPVGTVKLTASLPITGSGIYLPGGLNYVDLGSTYDLIALGTPNFVLTCWVMQDNNFSTANYQGIIGRSTGGATSIQYMIGTAGDASYGSRMRNAAGTAADISAGGTNAKNVAAQLALSWVNGTATFYLNGVSTGSAALTAPLATAAVNTWVGNMASGTNGFKGKIFRWGMKTLPSTTTAASQVTADYTMNSNRYS